MATIQVREGLTPDREARIDRGRQARAAKIEASEFARDHEQKIISELVAAYRNRGLTYEFCVGKVGEIVAIRDLLSTLESFETQGNALKEKMYGAP